MKIAVNDIKILDRIRTDEGDIDVLAQSIEQIGLIQPIVISEEYELLSGFRRLQACKKLGWKTIEVKTITIGADDVRRIDWEYHENIGRKDLTEEEKQGYLEKRETLTKPIRIGFWQTIKNFIAKLFSFLGRKKGV